MSLPETVNKRKLQDYESAALPSSSPSKKCKQGSDPLVLISVGTTSSSNNTQEAFHLQVGNTLGRNPVKKSKMAASHVDMNITDIHIPRKFLQVSKTTTDQLELTVFHDKEGKNKEQAEQKYHKLSRLASDIVTILRKKEELSVNGTKPIVLQEGDTLKIAQDIKECQFCYQFQLAPKTYRPAGSMGHAVTNFEPPPPPAAKSDNASPTKSPARKQASQDLDSDDDADDDEEEDYQKRDLVMHATYANTYWKALNTSTPHVGTTFLHTLLHQKKLPTPQLLQDLVQLLTFGPTFQKDHPFYDGNRLQLALRYIQVLLLKHPHKMAPRLCQAASQVAEGGDYSRLVMDQLHILAYANHSNEDSTTTQSQKDVLLDHSLQLHSFSLELLLLLLKHDTATATTTTTTTTGTTIQKDSKQVTRYVAQTMAHVWVEQGHLILEAADNASLADALEHVTRKLTQVLGLVAKHDRKTELVDLLWNAMHGQFRQTQNAEAKQKKKQLLLLWVCNLEDLAANHVNWRSVVQSLAKRASLGKEYIKLSTC
jgi:hypothetical protein